MTKENRLRTAREKQGLSRPEFAERLGVTRACVHNWEMGKRWPSWEMQLRIVKALGLPETWMVPR